MQHGVAEDGAERGRDADRRLDAVEDERAEQAGCGERLAACEVVREEPRGDDGGADEAGNDAFAQDRALFARHGRSRAYGSTRTEATLPPSSRFAVSPAASRPSADHAPAGSRSPNSAA